MKNKTPLRLLIERYLSEPDEGEWLDIPYRNNQQRQKIYSMAYSMKQQGYPIDIMESDRVTSIFWILRAKA